MSFKHTEKYLNSRREKFFNKCEELGITKNINIIGEYLNSHEHILCECKTCKHTWNATPTGLLSGKSCPFCSIEKRRKKQTKTNKKFLAECKNKGILNKIEILDDYINAKTKIKCYCKIHNYEWEIIPDSLLNGCGCPICGIEETAKKRTLTNEQYDKKLEESNKNFIRIGDYITAKTKILFKCKDCNNVFETTPDAVLRKNYSCPICGEKDSFNNRLMYNIGLDLELKNLKKEFMPAWAKPYRYDIYFTIKEKEFIVEMDGGFHKRPHPKSKKSLKEIQDIDKLKNKLAQQHNIEIIRIDCDTCSHEKIIENIKNSRLNQLLDLSLIDWNKCIKNAEKNGAKKICNYYKNQKENLSTNELGKIFNKDRHMVLKYLRLGNQLGWCVYPKISRKIIAMNGYKEILGIFSSSTLCMKYFFSNLNIQLNPHEINAVANGRRKTYRGFIFIAKNFDNENQKFL